MKKNLKSTLQALKKNKKSLARKLCPIFLAAIASLFPATLSKTQADLIGVGTPNWTVTGGSPWTQLIGSGKNTPANNPKNLTVNADGEVKSSNYPAISLGNDIVITIYGKVDGNINSGNGLYGTGPNLIEVNANNQIIVKSGGSIVKTGSNNYAEAINLHGFGNTVTVEQGGLISATNSSAIWFQDQTGSGQGDPNVRNVVDNSGTIIRVGGGNVIGTSAGNGVVFYNRSTGDVEGDLQFAQGNDDLIFEAGSKITGNIDGGGGNNSLTLQGDASAGEGNLNGWVKNFQTLTKTGKGTWNITASLEGFKTTTVNDGILRITGNNSNYTGMLLINRNDSLGQIGIVEAKARSLPTNSPTTGYTNNVTNNGILRFIDQTTDDDGGIGSYNGQIVGSGSVEMIGNGVVVLAPNAANGNTYTGGTWIKNGTIAITKTTALGTGDIKMGSGDSVATNGTLRLDGDNINLTESIGLLTGGGTINTNGHDGTVSGLISGTAGFTKAGPGTLTLLNENTYTGGTTISGGELQLGNGGTIGSIYANGSVNITNSTAALVINHSDGYTVSGLISGSGKVIQRGTGTTTLTNNANTFTGGTEIEAGQINVTNTNFSAYGITNGATNNAGHITYTGGNVSKTVNVNSAALFNHIRTETGTNNIFQTTGDLTMSGITNNSPDENLGGAFYVGSGTSLNVNLNGNLTMIANRAGSANNDIYIANGGTMNLDIADGKTASSYSGLNGSGTLNLTDKGTFQLNASNDSRMGTTNVLAGTFHLNNSNYINDNSFNLSDGATLIGNGDIEAGNSLLLAGTVSPGVNRGDNKTLVFAGSENATIANTFVYDYDALLPNSTQPNQIDVTEAEKDPRNTANDLIQFGGQTITINSPSDGKKAAIDLKTAYNPVTGKMEQLANGRYLLINSDGATFQNSGGTLLDNVALNTLFDTRLNGESITVASPRWDFAYYFDNQAGQPVNTQIWIDFGQNSLTMEWFGSGGNSDTPTSGTWIYNQDRMKSMQTNVLDGETNYDYQFRDGDKVHLYTAANGSGMNIWMNLYDNLPESPASNVIVSGLVVGQRGDNVTIPTNQGEIVIAGSGGITADKSSAYGIYVEGYDTPILVATGKLEKFGDGTFTLSNTGINDFFNGIDIYNGIVNIDSAAQDRLGVYQRGGTNAGIVTFVNGNAGGTDITARLLQVAGNAQKLKNQFIVDSNVTNANINAFHETTLLDLGSTSSIFLNENSTLNIHNSGRSVSLNPPVFIPYGLYVQGAVEGAASSTINVLSNSFGVGFTQIEKNSGFAGTTNIGDGSQVGSLRIIKDVTYGNATNTGFNLTKSGNLEGAGIIRTTNAVVGGVVSPDIATKTPDSKALFNGQQFATITFQGNGTGSTLVFNSTQTGLDTREGFRFDYNIKGVNTTAVAADTPNDLLAVRGMETVTMNGGVINFVGTGPTTGDYLIIDSDTAINVTGGVLDGINSRPSGVLWAKVNGVDILKDTPRGNFTLDFDDVNDDDTAGKQIWLHVDHNTLEMVWQGGDGVWASDNWKSVQSHLGTIYDYSFYDGDLVYFNDTTGGSTNYTVTLDYNDIVSGMDVNMAGATSNVTISGTGGITAYQTNPPGTDYIHGEYANTVNPQNFATTGALIKKGLGTLTLATETANVWTNGTEIFGGTIKLSGTDVLGVYTGSSNGTVRFMGNDTNVVSTKAQTIRNKFFVDSGIQRARIATEDTSGASASHLTVTAGSTETAVVVNSNAGLILDAAGGDIVFSNNATDISLDANSALNFRGNQNIYINNGIFDNASGSSKTVTREAGGFTQIGNNTAQNANYAINANTTVQDGGTFRVIQDVTYGAAGTFTVNLGPQGGTLAGGGTVKADTFVINGIISPDTATFSTGNTTLTDTNKYGKLTLQGNGATSVATLADDTFNPFVFNYDAKEANTTTDKNNTPNDLLSILGMNTITLNSGTINISPSGTYLETGKYLIVDADQVISVTGGQTNDNLNDKLKGKINGQAFESLSPRVWYLFRFNDDTNGTNEASLDYSQIWLDAELNSLTMDWTPTGGSITWDTTSSNFTSLQKNAAGDVSEKVFRNGDKVHFSGNSDLDVTLNTDVIVSGMVGGRNSGTTGLDGTDTTGKVTISGTGSIHAKTSDPSIVGRYKDPGTGVGNPKMQVTGKLEKYGSGELVFRNIGGNMFTEGVELYGGVTGINQADQLGVGSGKAITFKDNATLRSDAVVAMNQTVRIDSGKTATFDAGAGNALLLDGTLAENTAPGSVTKTGIGILQIKNNASISGTTKVEEGTFRVVGDRDTTQAVYGNNVPGSSFTLDTGARLAGGGTVQAEAIVINGTLAPDSAMLTADNMVIGDKKRGTLTLRNAESITLDGFTLEYDVFAPNTSSDPSLTPNDLLQVRGNTTIESGTINFIGSLTSGEYLIIDSNIGITVGGNGIIDGIQNGGVLQGQLNGVKIDEVSPRGDHEFVLKDYSDTDSQVWLVVERNTLTMNRNTGGDWFGNTDWTSTQYVPIIDVNPPTDVNKYAHSFENGDYVKLASDSGDSYTLNLNGDALVSGMDIDSDGEITIDGTGSLQATSDRSNPHIEGIYIDVPSWTNDRNIIPTGNLYKTGSGDLVFRNTGGNNFEDGIFLENGTVGFNRTNQLGTTDSSGVDNGINFIGNSTLRADTSLTLGNKINIANNIIGSIEVIADGHLDYNGEMMSGNASSTLKKTGDGTLNLYSNNTQTESLFAGAVDVSEGTLGVYANYGNTDKFAVQSGATLTGWGTIGAQNGGVIKSDGHLAPNGLSTFVSANQAPTEVPLTVKGDLTFEAGSNFDVRITQFDNGGEKLTPYSDCVVVENGSVSIDPNAKLNVEFDFWGDTLSIYNFNAEQSEHFTIIDANDGIVENSDAKFLLSLSNNLPRGVVMQQGWNSDSGKEFQLWFEEGNGFEDLCPRHNRNEIGKNLDQLVWARDPGLRDLIDHLSDPSLSDADVCDILDRLTGDLTPNAMMMALKKPWRHPFNRISLDQGSCTPCGAVKNPYKRELWGEFYGRYDDVRYDGNAHPFTVNRYGVVVGVDQQLSRRSIVGVSFNYSDPRLRQDTGKVEMDDYEIGLYGMTKLGSNYQMKLYAGYSHQRYDFDRWVYIPETEHFAALSERFKSKTDGNAFSASVELTRPIRYRSNLLFLPTIAFDFEQAWMKGYSEKGGLTALKYDNSTLERMMFRFGLSTEYSVRTNLDLKARIQYATQVNSNEYPRIGVQFVNATLSDQRHADIWGSRIGRDYLNLGIGADWKLNTKRTFVLFVNYDADLYKRATTHAGEVGLVRKW